jgi:hypothetical protein
MLMHEDGKTGTVVRENDVFSPDIATLQATATEFALTDEHQKKSARLFVTTGGTTKMTLPGITEPVPVTLAPSPMLALYDEKAQTRAMLDSGDISFLNPHASAQASGTEP